MPPGIEMLPAKTSSNYHLAISVDVEILERNWLKITYFVK